MDTPDLDRKASELSSDHMDKVLALYKYQLTEEGVVLFAKTVSPWEQFLKSEAGPDAPACCGCLKIKH